MTYKHESMIQKDGSLKIENSSKKADWYEFFYYSRHLNSKFGGWNFKSYWKSDALEKLSSNEIIIETYTKNTIQNINPARPLREKDFMLKRDLVEKRGAEDSENLLNFNLFNHLQNSNESFQSIGYEIPLVATNESQLKVDLFAIQKETQHPNIIEIKRKDNTDDSPLFGIVEAITYGFQFWKCQNFIKREYTGHYSEELNCDVIHLSLIAEEDYFKYWNFESKDIENVKKIIQTINNCIQSKNIEFPKGLKPFEFRLEVYIFNGEKLRKLD
ncbi:hypothetical protein [Leptospira levettii]|uniref:hypothetical protein n=1 Tax=Leptospira levettii TaxID=2023178 RepID=UPI000C2AE900|nr:hypothetical protein [Leptospira levettii]PJZ89044.1 hypothetical protein CH368_08440 [Leptospira levettii]